jgi:hypothetical protein
VGLVHHEVVDPRVAGVVDDALDGDAGDGDELFVRRTVLGLTPAFGVEPVQPVVLFVGPRVDELLVRVGPELAQDRDRRVPLGFGCQLFDSRLGRAGGIEGI